MYRIECYKDVAHRLEVRVNNDKTQLTVYCAQCKGNPIVVVPGHSHAVLITGARLELIGGAHATS